MMKRLAACFFLTLSVCFSAPRIVVADGFVWEPTLSSYATDSGSGRASFYDLDPTVAAAAGFGSGEGYGTTASNGIGNPLNGMTAYGGRAPDSLSPEGINERPGHFYFGFANTYPNTNTFSAYEIGGTPLNAAGDNDLDLWFRRTTSDPINFIGIAGGIPQSGGQMRIGREVVDGDEYLRIESSPVNPVFSSQGGGDQTSVFGLYINYGEYDSDNEGVDYHGASFQTNIHWWDIDVPNISRDKLASIKLASEGGQTAHVTGYIPSSYLDSIGANPNDIRGFIDDELLPQGPDDDGEAGSGGYNYSFHRGGMVTGDHNLDGIDEDLYRYRIYNNRWSPHDFRFGAVPEPSSMIILGMSLLGLGLRRRRI